MAALQGQFCSDGGAGREWGGGGGEGRDRTSSTFLNDPPFFSLGLILLFFASGWDVDDSKVLILYAGGTIGMLQSDVG